MKAVPGLFVALIACCGPAWAAPGDRIDLTVRYGHYHEDVTVNKDGTSVETIEWSRTVLKKTALDGSKSAEVNYSTSAEKAEIVSAYTLKKDGRRIDVPRDNYQVEINKGKDKDSPVYSDRTTLSVVFPDVEVGDSVVFSYRISETQPMFPNNYSAARVFSSSVAYDDVRIRFDYPSAMWVQYAGYGMKQTEGDAGGGRKTIEWRYANPAPVQSARRDYSVYDPEKEVGYAFSTFRSYADIAKAYGERALPRAATTDRVAALAAGIVKGAKSPKEEARALYEWVATNISYAGNCIGVGAVVPRDVSFVLDNKMGDCKDHATLLQALLAARGIRSTQALVNAGSIYRLPAIPVVSTVNHVINYLPDFGLYLDSTSDSTPFGMLPLADQDKPVLLVEGFKADARTPVAAPGSSRQRVVSRLKIAPDGAATGSVEVFQEGEEAARMRAAMRELSKNAETDAVKNLLRRRGLIGDGTFVKDDPAGLKAAYHYKMTFSAKEYLKVPGAAAFYVYPPLGVGRGIASYLQGSVDEPEKDVDVTCSGIYVEEEYVIDIPRTVKILAVPDDMKIGNGTLSYNASYKLKGHVLRVKRVLDDRTPGNLCTPKMAADYKKVADKVMENLREQVLYK